MRPAALIASLTLVASVLAVPAQSSDASAGAPSATPSVHRWRKSPASMHYRPEAAATPLSPLAHHTPARTPPPSGARVALAPRDSSEPPPPHGPESNPPRFHGDPSVVRRAGGAAMDGPSAPFDRTYADPPRRHDHEGGPARLHAHDSDSSRSHGKAAVGGHALDSDSEFDECEQDMDLQ
jgi:hypothetical protein